MQIKSGIIVAILVLLVGLVPAVGAQAPQQQAAITSFSSSAEGVSSNALTSGSARVPVSWSVSDRPANSNLVFEQLFPDGRVQNVELPRNFTLVPSSGDGMVAPVATGGDNVVIQVRLVDLNSNAVYAQQQITLPITDDPVPDPNIDSFTSTRTSVSVGELNAGVLIPVSWSVSNRPANANLFFIQQLPDGTAVNVELPRDVREVPSSGIGVVLPRNPGDEDELVLGVSLAVPDSDVLFDYVELTIPITSDTTQPTAQIDSFTTSTTGVGRADLAGGGVRIPVSWSVSNRPPNSNLYFVQFLPDGRVPNVELPRNFVIIPSSGDGVVAPLLPGSDNQIHLGLTFALINSDQALDSAELFIPIVNNPTDPPPVVDPAPIPEPGVAFGAVCFRLPFQPSNGIEWADTGIVIAQAAIDVVDSPLGNSVGTLEPGDSFTVVDDSPACYQLPIATNNRTEYRLWHVRADDGTDGWVIDYTRNLLGTAYLIQPSNATPVVDACYELPYAPDAGIQVGSQVTVSNNVPAEGLLITVVNPTGQNIDPAEFDSLKPGGTLNVVGGPVCRNEGDTLFGHVRSWRIRTNSGALEGWVFEHSNVLGNTVQYLEAPK